MTSIARVSGGNVTLVVPRRISRVMGIMKGDTMMWRIVTRDGIEVAEVWKA